MHQHSSGGLGAGTGFGFRGVGVGVVRRFFAGGRFAGALAKAATQAHRVPAAARRTLADAEAGTA